MTRRLLVLLSLVSPAWGADSAPVKPPIAANPIVEVRGTITRVHFAPGQGMPFLEIETAQGPVQLGLGSIRYLMQENFNPKAGETVEAKGYRLEDRRVVAIRVDLPASKKSVRLRDENGWPVWMGGRRGMNSR